MIVLILLLTLLFGVSCNSIPEQGKELSAESLFAIDVSGPEQRNGLSAELVFEIDDSGPSAYIIHPKIILRNDSDKPIKFFRCVYHAGRFNVKRADGSTTGLLTGSTRSGPQGAEVVEIKPGKKLELDAYDHGYGIPPNRGIYTFNTSSFQRSLKPGEYLVDYSLDLDKEKLKRILKMYSWVKDSPEDLWTGKIILRDVKMILK